MGHPEEVDVIVCGYVFGPSSSRLTDSLTTVALIYSGGPAGSVVAGRLAYADPNLKVMLIEGM